MGGFSDLASKITGQRGEPPAKPVLIEIKTDVTRVVTDKNMRLTEHNDANGVREYGLQRQSGSFSSFSGLNIDDLDSIAKLIAILRAQPAPTGGEESSVK